ncbi:MAG: ATP-dependent DNA helicase DinG [Oleiphilaceae bacterium]|jgi:ATP-dependent DNA helicase DinG
MLTESQKKLIQTSYRKFTGREGFRPRFGQRVMIAEIAKYLGSIEENDQGLRKSPPAVCVIEAGTGTGKTLAYSISVLPLALEEGRTVIISTATTALQEQVMSKDLPELAKYSGLKFNYTLAKGRGRYVCLSKLDQQLENTGSEQSALPLFMMQGDNHTVDKSELEVFLSSYASGKWDGDRDTWESVIDNDVWRSLSTDNQQCSKRRCSYFNSCPYYETRKTWDDADVIVVNHDLLLSDLALGGGVLLPAPESSILVLDEAHHLADKALNHFTVNGGLKSADTWLKSMSKVMVEFSPYLGQGNYLGRHIADISEVSTKLHEWLTRTYDFLIETIDWDQEESNGARRYRFKQAIIPDALLEMAGELKVMFASLCRLLDDIRSEVTKAVDEKSDCGLSREEGEQWFPVFGSLCNRAENLHALWMFYGKEQKEGGVPNARWLVYREYENQADISLFGSPLSAGGVLHEELWKKCYGAILTSATLTALGTFDRLSQKAGLPKESVYHKVESPFDFYNVANLLIPNMKASAGEPEAHTQEISSNLVRWIGEHKAVLVLFSSRRQMNDVYFQVDQSLREDIMTQDDFSKQELIKKHKSKIDAGERSFLFGLASLSEGVDLPGNYLTHVIIAKIPFSVPNDPLEESISEWLESQGRNPFMEVSVPDASLKLIQACGRLIRTEQDTGQITILDNRLITRRYGNLIINSLPPYRRVIE